MKSRSEEIVRASWIGIIGNTILAVLKITIGFISGSLAVIGDGIDSSIDILTFFITLFTAKIISKPPDIKYPYGYKKAETLATKVLAFIIFFVGAQFFISTISRIINGIEHEIPSIIAIYVTILSIAGKGVLSFWQYKIAKRTESSMLFANAKNMRNDIIISISVLLGLFFTFILEMPVLDIITAMAVSIWIMKTAFEIFMETNTELMDGVKDTTIYHKIIKAVDSVKGAYNPHRIRVRKTSNLFFIDLDVEVDKNIKVSEAHQIAKNVENKLKENIDNIYDILVHIEPLGNIEKDEHYGVSKDNIDEKI
ncbi:MAG: cation diffusion facilitator family transporter [Bacteroidales bacterium]|nr:cation diffusion facilitator family transporter [Bacteroidales bacterium]